ncbi:MAG: hypothetical protein V3S62_06080 [Acidimicrobiia bacterium]
MTDSQRPGAAQRWFLGVVAAGFLAGGLVLALVSDPGPDELAWGGILLRSGMLLGAWWLVLPNARRVRRTTWVSAGIVGIVLAVRPRLILWGLLVAVLVAFSSARGRRHSG